MDLKGFITRAILFNPAMPATLAGNRWGGIWPLPQALDTIEKPAAAACLTLKTSICKKREHTWTQSVTESNLLIYSILCVFNLVAPGLIIMNINFFTDVD